MKVDMLHGDCLELMKNIPDKSIDMILCDLPYGTTNNKWDKKIDLQALWEQYKRIIKVNAAIVLFSQMPFCVDLIVSNRKWFRYEWIWQKDNTTGFLNANKMPLKCHENILLFIVNSQRIILSFQKERRIIGKTEQFQNAIVNMLSI